MKLLIITQKVDHKDPILGFFHRWLEEFSKNAQVTVIGQSVGEHHLPDVTVLSLEKEKGRSRVGQIFRFWRLIWSHRRAYDVVLVHMTPIWIVLGAPVWLLLRKRMYLWYEARGGRWPLRIAAVLVQKIFSASRYGMPFASKKHMIVGHGIDVEAFQSTDAHRDENLLITVGRFAPSKRLEIIINAFAVLPHNFYLRLAGLPLIERDRPYAKKIDDLIDEKKLRGERLKHVPLSQSQVIHLLQTATLFLHASATALDKALLEAMSCECPVVSCAEVAALLPEECRSTPENFTADVQRMLARPPAERAAIGRRLRDVVERDHSLSRLIDRLVAEMASATL